MSKPKSKKASQGSPLPVDGSRLGAYPVGSCVMIEVDGATDWHMITYVLSGNDNPHMRKMRHPPSSPDWNVGPSHTREFKSNIVVIRSAWPRRVADERGLGDTDTDPMVTNLRLDNPAGSATGEDGGRA